MNMLRNIKFRLSALAVLLLATSCLDKYPESAIPEKDAMKTFADAEQTLTGIYASLKSNALYSGYLTLLPDIQADLVYAVEGNTNTYGSFWRWDIRPTDLQLEAVYAALYKVIGNCNFYLDRIDEVVANEISDTNIEKLEQYTGEVYAVRALCYTELLKTFCKAYEPDTAQSELGVVLRTKYFTPEAARRASLYDSYQFVLDDLAEAEKRLDKENDAYGNVYMTSASAEALPARVALGCRIIQLHYAASDREVVALVQESPYLQYFLGFESFTDAVPFSSRTVARFRARIPDKAVRPAVRLLRSFQ